MEGNRAAAAAGGEEEGGEEDAMLSPVPPLTLTHSALRATSPPLLPLPPPPPTTPPSAFRSAAGKVFGEAADKNLGVAAALAEAAALAGRLDFVWGLRLLGKVMDLLKGLTGAAAATPRIGEGGRHVSYGILFGELGL
jgi:hypothetical protein